MSTIIVKLICLNRIKLLESDGFVKYPEIRSTYDSMVPTPLRVGFSNLLFKNDKNEIFEINDNESFWAFITLHYPRAKIHINETPIIIIPVLVDNPDYLNTNGLKVHQHIICDSCDRKVAGIRYKCAVCNDYDLCQYCEKQNIHDPSHVMIRFARPIDCNSRKYLNIINQLKSEDFINDTFESSNKNENIVKKSCNIENGDKNVNKKDDSKILMDNISNDQDTKTQTTNLDSEFYDACKNYLGLVNELKSIKKDVEEKYSNYDKKMVNELIIADFLAKTLAKNFSFQQTLGILRLIAIQQKSTMKLSEILEIQNDKEILKNITEAYFDIIKSSNENITSTNDKSTNEEFKNSSTEDEQKDISSSSGSISLVESFTTGSDIDTNRERKLPAFELSITSIKSTDEEEEEDVESNYGIEIVDHRSEANTSSSISDWKDRNDELDYKLLVKQMELQRSGVFEKIVDDIEPEDSASMIGSRNSFIDTDGNKETEDSSLSFSIISRHTNDTITSDKN